MINGDILGDRPFVFFDLETTGHLNTDPDILQIGAVTHDCSDSFDLYLKPNRKDTDNCKNINYIEFDPESKTILKLSDSTTVKRKCSSVDAKTGISEFLDWLAVIGNGGRVNLVAYNGHKFDSVVLIKRVREFGLEKQLYNVISGFVDPLRTARMFYSNLESKK